MRFIFYLFLTCTALILGTLILAPSLFDINTYKSKIIELVNKKTKADLKIKGNLNLSLFPEAKISFEEVSFSKNGIPELFYSKKIFVYPSIFSLLKGELKFDKVKVENSVINIEKNKNNKTNWEELFSKKKIDKKKEIEKDVTSLNEKPAINNFSENKELLLINELIIKESKLIYKNSKEVIELKNIDCLFVQKNPNFFKIKGNLIFQKELIEFKYDIKAIDKNYLIQGEGTFNNTILKKSMEINFAKKEANGYLDLKSRDVNKYLDYKGLKKILIESSGYISFRKDKVTLKDINIKANNNYLKGEVEYKINRNTNDLNILLVSNEIDIANFYEKKISFMENDNSKKNINKDNSEIKRTKNDVSYENLYGYYFEKINNQNIDFQILCKSYIGYNLNIKNLKVNFNNKKKPIVNISSSGFLGGKVAGLLVFDKKANINIDLEGNDLALNKLTKAYRFKKINGKMDIKNKYKLTFRNNIEFIKNLSGSTELNLKELKLLGINFNNFSEKVLNISSLNEVSELKKELFLGDTNLEGFTVNLALKNGLISIPKTIIILDNEKLAVSGTHNLINNKLDLNANYADSKAKVLSLFDINFNGNINNLTTNINFNEKKLVTLLEEMAQNKLKKILEDKLEKKFDNLMDNLLN